MKVSSSRPTTLSIANAAIGLGDSVSPSPTAVLISPTVPVPPAADRDSSSPPPRTRVTPPQHPAARAPSPPPFITSLQPSVSWSSSPALPTIATAPAKPPTPEILISNVPLKPFSEYKLADDKIAAAFHNSSRKTLNYIPPSVQNSEVLVRPTIDMIREGSNRWNTTAVGYFLEVGAGHGVAKVETYRSPGMDQTSALTDGVMDDGWFEHGDEWDWPAALPRCDYSSMHETIFARVCVMLNVSSNLPKYIVIMMPNEQGGESACKVDVEYEWLPPKCTRCTSLGHAMKECSLTEPVKLAVSIYVKKTTVQTPALESTKGDQVSATPNRDGVHPVAEVDTVSEELSAHRRDKGATIIALMRAADDDAEDYSGPGNRIWIAWNDEFIDVDILDIGTQFVHCRVLILKLHETILTTVVYGANDVSARRELWQGLTDLAVSVENVPWSLWKRLDRMFVNDAWMERWPNLFYTCLTPRTSDHSSLVLTGDSRNVQVSMFRFDNYLALSPGFLASVHTIWQHPVIGTPMYSVTRKLKALKPVFRQQQRNKGDLALNVKLVYLKATKLEHVMLRQRAKLQWLKGGDQCSKGLLGGERTVRVLDLHYLRPWARHILTEEEAQTLRPVTMDDVKTTMFDIEEDKAPGPDGFSSSFYKVAWPIVGEEISKAIMDFFTTGQWIEECVTSAHFSVYVNGECMDSLQGHGGSDKELKLLQLSFADDLLLLWRVQLIEFVLVSFEVYWAMAFILPKGIIKEVIKRLRTFLWRGTSSSRYPKVAWEVVCRPVEEGGQGIRDIFALNRALMSKHLWAVIKQDRTSIWVDWIIQIRLRDCSIWTVKENKGAWGWRKILTLRHTLLSHIHFLVGDTTSFSLWHDPWHPLGPLIIRFPRGPQLTNTGLLDKLNVVMANEGTDRIIWKSNDASFTTMAAYALFHPPGPKVGWSSLLLGPFKIPKNCFILWLAILGRLSTLDKPWLQHIGGNCILCSDGCPETHDHLYFACPFARRCLAIIRRQIPFPWPHHDWQRGILWASSRWRGKHVVNAAYRALLASLVYHLWQEHNTRRFQQSSRPPSIVGSIVVEEIRQKIISAHLRLSVSTQGLYRLWKIPWPVEGDSD
ncbi:UNVERIFIED_CONTAM: hypothetical protein Scaly_0603100 [Sesamum calycinum]|uniref:Reverse transcriptase zinc-binding domain-containing protein n=1 Tax=Sesamum calycinum TaxID=2727403 RepID=A0AAW2RSL6_9LAMI